MNLYNNLQNILKDENKFTKDGKLFKNSIVEAALKLDPDLIKILLKDELVKSVFFRDINGITIFDKSKFQQFISNKEFLPDSYTRYKNKIGFTINNRYLTEEDEVVLTWPYKDCILEGGQTKDDKKRKKEIFWNTTLAHDEIDVLYEPKVFTNWTKHEKSKTSKPENISDGENLIINGNNLVALHSLEKVYKGKIKLIYIDPPYNTGNDSFQYNDSFNHSTWLTFMKNRLEVAQRLLSNDGFIFIQIDNKEEAYLKVLCDSIFKSDNYRNTIITKKGMKSLQKQFSHIQKLNAGFDSILLYSKKPETKLPVLFKKLNKSTKPSWNNHWRGTNRPTMRYEIFGIKPDTGQWRWSKERTQLAIDNFEKLMEFILAEENDENPSDELIDKYYEEYLYANGINDVSDFELVRLSSNGKPEHYIPPQDQILLSENWMDLTVAGRVTKFEHEKNEEILKRIIEWVTKKGDIVLDFFLGSGTTAAVAHKLERQYIGIEQMNYGEHSAVNRLKKVINGKDKGLNFKGGGTFISMDIMQNNERFLKALNEADESEFNILLDEVLDSPFTSFKLNKLVAKESKEEFQSLSVEDKKRLVKMMLDNNNLYVNYYEALDSSFAISETDIKLNNQFYN